MTSKSPLWRQGDFLRLWAAQTVSDFGARITREGLPMMAVMALAATPSQLGLLYALSSAPDRVFTRQQLIDRIFGENYAVTDRTIDAHVKALRKKLLAAGADPDLIETERGVGYRLRERG